MIIRRAEKKDLEGVNSLLRQVLYVHHVDRPDIFKAVGKKYRDDELLGIMADDSTPLFVAVDENDKVLGHLFTIVQEVKNHSSLEDMKTLYIDDICIDENHRGEYIGKALYEFALKYAERIGCYNVTLNVWAENKKALGFYEAMGLKVQKYGMEKIL